MASSTIKGVANELGAYIDISSYTESSPYVAPSDGYVFIYNASSQSGYVGVHGKTTNDVIAVGGAFGRYSVLVKRGMRAYAIGTSTAMRFVPLV